MQETVMNGGNTPHFPRGADAATGITSAGLDGLEYNATMTLPTQESA